MAQQQNVFGFIPAHLQPLVGFHQQPIAFSATPSTDNFHSITAADQYQNVSFEELRLQDYQNGRGIYPRYSHSAFAPLPPGLVRADVPQSNKSLFSQFWPTSCRTTKSTAAPLASKIIVLRVGKEGESQDFFVHDDMISRRSEFVRMAMKHEWKEAKERIIPLPEDLPGTFYLYQQWVYTRTIPSDQPEDPEKDAKEFDALVRAFILGEKLIDPDFKDAVIDCIIHKLQVTSTFDISLSGLVYENTPSHSALRRLWQHIYTWSGNQNWLDENELADFVHAEFSVDLAKLQMSFWQGQRPKKAPYMDDPCTYHEHASGKCYKYRGNGSDGGF